jgi:putative FmdB family regulatory protein
MPIYDYLCSACDHRADILHGINDPGPLFCPSCGAEGTMRKQFSAPTIHFKGSGWAKKDRGGSARTKAAKAAGEGGNATDSAGGAAASSSDDASSSGPSGPTPSGPSGPSGPSSSSSSSSDTPKPSTTD